MRELILTALGLYLISKYKKPSVVEPTGPALPTGPVRTATGKVIAPWPMEVPNRVDFMKLWEAGGNYGNVDGVFVEFIGPATVCSWPQKFKVKSDILSLYDQLSKLANEKQQISPNDVRALDDLTDKILEANSKLKNAYQALKNGCMSYVPGATGTPITTIAPGRQA